MKEKISAYVVFELAMFAIMVLFLSFCGFFTLKHCFYIWRKKKRRRRDDSLESILDLLYNEDYYYLESTTPYLPENGDSGDELAQKRSETVGSTEDDEACFDSSPSQGRSVKWNGPEKISIDKFQVCPQSVKPEIRHLLSADGCPNPKSKLKRQIQVHLSGSSDNFCDGAQSIPLTVSQTHVQAGPGDKQMSDLEHQGPSPRVDEPRHPESKPHGQLAPFSIKKLVSTSKFIGATHRAKKQLRMQSRFPPGTFRYRSDESGDGSDSPRQDRKPLLKSESAGSPQNKRKVSFLGHVGLSRKHSARGPHDTREHKQKSTESKGKRKLPSPQSAFSYFPKQHGPDDSGHSQERRSDVEELCEEYERMEKNQYAEMLKKAKSFRRENLPFLHRKHFSS